MTRDTSPRRTVVIQRVYDADEGACAQAVGLLLKGHSKQRGRSTTSGPDDGKEIKNVPATNSYTE